VAATTWTDHDIAWKDHWQLTLAYVASGRDWEGARKQAAMDLAVPPEEQVRNGPSGRVCVSTAEVPHEAPRSGDTLRVRIGWASS